MSLDGQEGSVMAYTKSAKDFMTMRKSTSTGQNFYFFNLLASFVKYKWKILALPALLSGCALLESWDHANNRWVGHPISEFVKLNGMPTLVASKGGEVQEYKFELPRSGVDCVQVFDVNATGIIIGGHHAGWCSLVG
jgi:hypothetical protein